MITELECAPPGVWILGRSRSRSQYFKFDPNRSRSQLQGLCKSQSKILKESIKISVMMFVAVKLNEIETCFLASVVIYQNSVTLSGSTEHFATYDGFRS